MTRKPTESLADGYVKWVRSKVGSQLIYLAYAGVVIFDNQGRILVQERYDFDWLSTPGGAMELGESLLETARREVREETGLEADIKGLVGVYSHPRFNLLYPNGDRVQQWTACFWGTVGGGELQPDGGETLKLHFMAPEEVLKRTHISHEYFIRDALRVRLGGPPHMEEPYSAPALTPYYPILREHVGHDPVILPGTLAVIEDEQGRILMVRRADTGQWDFPAGFADLGESTTANIIREVREETGLDVEPTGIIGLYSAPRWFYGTHINGDVTQGVGVGFACRVTGGALDAQGHDDESTAVAYLSLAQIMAECSDTVRDILRDYADRDNWPHIR